MKTLHTNFQLWTGNVVYFINDGRIKEGTITYTLHAFKDSPNLKDCYSNIRYGLHYGNKNIEITEKDINTIYFTDKNELIKHLISQL